MILRYFTNSGAEVSSILELLTERSNNDCTHRSMLWMYASFWSEIRKLARKSGNRGVKIVTCNRQNLMSRYSAALLLQLTNQRDLMDRDYMVCPLFGAMAATRIFMHLICYSNWRKIDCNKRIIVMSLVVLTTNNFVFPFVLLVTGWIQSRMSFRELRSKWFWQHWRVYLSLKPSVIGVKISRRSWDRWVIHA